MPARTTVEELRQAIVDAVPEGGEIEYTELVANLRAQGYDVGFGMIQQVKNTGAIKTKLFVENGQRRHVVVRGSAVR